jgi:hypothetical protein
MIVRKIETGIEREHLVTHGKHSPGARRRHREGR